VLAFYKQLADAEWSAAIELDISLARGLNYYTGIIVEVTTAAVKMGSIGGGGRYDDLTGLFGVSGISGVGISFGIDRIYDVLDELNAFPEQLVAGTQVLLVNFGGENESYALTVLQKLRAASISAELYPDVVKFDKQMKYANKRSIPFVMLLGDDEREKGMIGLKDFTTGTQHLLSIGDCINILKSN
jgi:histidyl-tRNA synthetase